MSNGKWVAAAVTLASVAAWLSLPGPLHVDRFESAQIAVGVVLGAAAMVALSAVLNRWFDPRGILHRGLDPVDPPPFP